ncbi:MAG: hypothetical protein JWN43_1168, partial [Gammaproteobacteria bacterium]|nr:hypothetical protein [Gammaproteobacteria bacterium]
MALATPVLAPEGHQVRSPNLERPLPASAAARLRMRPVGPFAAVARCVATGGYIGRGSQATAVDLSVRADPDWCDVGLLESTKKIVVLSKYELGPLYTTPTLSPCDDANAPSARLTIEFFRIGDIGIARQYRQLISQGNASRLKRQLKAGHGIRQSTFPNTDCDPLSCCFSTEVTDVADSTILSAPALSENTVATIAKQAGSDARRFLYGGFTAIALSALALTWLRSPAALVPVLLMLLVSAVCVGLLSSALNPEKATAAARTFLWAVMLFILSLMGLFVSAVFFGVPQTGAVAIARMFDAPELLAVGKGGAQLRVLPDQVKAVPAELLEPLDVAGKDDRFSRAQALRQRPSLRVEGILVA